MFVNHPFSTRYIGTRPLILHILLDRVVHVLYFSIVYLTNWYTSLILHLFLDRMGHALLAFRLSRVEAPLEPAKTLELGHHVLKAHIYRGSSRSTALPARELQAYWLQLSSENPSSALVSHHNLFSPNVKVSDHLLGRLILIREFRLYI